MAVIRKAHVKRIFKIMTNPETKQEEISTDIFVDVRRFENLPVIIRSADDGKVGQVISYKFFWNDDINNPVDGIDASNADLIFENANAKRKTERLRIKDPDVATDSGILPEGSSDSATSIEDNDIYLWIVNKLKVKMPQGEPTGRQNQIIELVFNNRPIDGSKGTPANRTTSYIKIVNNDLNNLKMLDANDKPLIMDWSIYKQALQDGKTDPKDELFLAVEFVDKFKVRFAADANTGSSGQDIGYFPTENKEDVEVLFEAIDPIDAKEIIRLDPLQVIVNVGSNIIAVEFMPKDE